MAKTVILGDFRRNLNPALNFRAFGQKFSGESVEKIFRICKKYLKKMATMNYFSGF